MLAQQLGQPRFGDILLAERDEQLRRFAHRRAIVRVGLRGTIVERDARFGGARLRLETREADQVCGCSGSISSAR
jgi:hypothetical protein